MAPSRIFVGSARTKSPAGVGKPAGRPRRYAGPLIAARQYQGWTFRGRPIALLRAPISRRPARREKYLSNAPPSLSAAVQRFAAMPTTNRGSFPGEYHRPSPPPVLTCVLTYARNER